MTCFPRPGVKCLIQFAAMLRHEDGTAPVDIEELHDMRVATRRMRAPSRCLMALNPSHPQAPKRTASHRARFGPVRDLDVFMEKAERYLATLPADQHAGLAPLLDSWKTEREQDRTLMLDHLDGRDYARFKEIPGLPDHPRCRGAPGLREMPFRRVRHIVLNWSIPGWRVRSFEAVVGNASWSRCTPCASSSKLRYTLEFFREVLGRKQGR
jgi:CHAD domain-containing protein